MTLPVDRFMRLSIRARVRAFGDDDYNGPGRHGAKRPGNDRLMNVGRLDSPRDRQEAREYKDALEDLEDTLSPDDN